MSWAWVWVILAGVAAVLVVSLKRLDSKRPKPGRISHLDEAHHGYYGLFIAIGVLAALTLPAWAVTILSGFAALCVVDDAFQHAVQAFGKNQYQFRSPLWRLYRWFLTRF